MKKRALSLLLTLTMLLSLVPAFGTVASAEEPESIKYIDVDSSEKTTAAAKVVTASDTDWGESGENTWYVATGKVTITNSVKVSGNVYLILADSATLTVTAKDGSSEAGINVATGNSLTIYGQEKGTGTLKATGKCTGNKGGAGVGCAGSDSAVSSGAITINGGAISATGAKFGAGIGGGTKGTGRNITINGGTVTAKGGAYGAGIGGGHKGSGKDITINGGTVTATGNKANDGGGAGIGGGGSNSKTSQAGSGRNITINGGIVTATGCTSTNGSRGSAGIGGGSSNTAAGGAAASIAINGGIVTAKGGTGAAAIGGGKGTSDGSASELSVDEDMYFKGGSATPISGVAAKIGTEGVAGKISNQYIKLAQTATYSVNDTPCAFFEDAVYYAEKDTTKPIVLTGDSVVRNSCALPSDNTITVKLSGFKFAVISDKRITGDSIAFDIASDKDMETVNALNKNTSQFEETSGGGTVKVSHIRVPEKQIWNITNNITTKTPIGATKLQGLTINGNGKTISGNADGEGGNYVMSFVNSLGFVHDFDATVNNITFKTTDNYEGCAYVASNRANTAKRTNVTFNNVTFDNTTCKAEYSGACIVNNWGSVTLKGQCTLKTGVNSYSAIDLTNESGDAELTIDGSANVTFTDGRVEAKKATEPLIGQDGTSVGHTYAVTGADVAGLRDSLRYGVYHNVPGTKSGFDFPVCKINNVEYGSISKAVAAATDGEKTIIELIYDTAEDVTIAAEKNIELDLNGKVLDLNGKHIVNKGTLTIADSNPTAAHTGTIADYAGGIITGGSGTDIDGVLNGIGGAIVVVKDGSDAALTMNAGTVVNCSAANGGAIFVGEGASFTMNGGKIAKCSAERGGGISNYRGTVSVSGTVESCTAQNYGGGIYNDVGLDDNSGNAIAKVTLNNGADIKNCAVLEGNENDLLGGGVYNKGTLIMNTGAVIEGCSAEKGAGVHNDGNTWVTFTMNGGEIKNNTAKRTDGGKSTGGGVQVSANSTFTMLGGTVTGNKTNATTQYGAGVYNKGTMTVGGAANITGNLHSNGITASNLCVATGKTVAVSAETVPTTMSIGISTETAPLGGNPAQPVQFGAVNSTDYSSHFTSDNGAYSVVYEDTAGTKDLRLKQTVFYVIDNVDGNNGSDTTGNGTSAKPYLTIQKAAEKASGTSVIKLLSGIKLDANASLPDNTTIMINGKTVEAIGDNRISGTNITVLVYDLADFTAANTFVKALADGTSCTFKLMNNIEISEALKLNGDIGNVIFDGNGKTITAVRDNFGKSEHAFSIKNEATSARSFTLKNATVNVNDGFRYGLYLEGKNGVINATVENVTINMNQTVAPRNSTGETTTAIIMDNYANVTIKSSFTANTNQFCWTAINVCAEKRNASLTFDTNANVSITDNRTDANKKAKMFIAFDGNTTNTCTATGKYITDNLVAAGTVGYNPPATVTFESNGGSDVAQKITAKYWYVEKPADNPTKSNNTFGGWYSDVACENAWNFANDKVTGATTLYAKWIQNSVEKAVVTGTVTDGSNPVNGAVVELRLGTEKVAAANTNASGTYTFDNVENGIYNIVVTKDGKTKTTVVNVNEASSFTVAPVVMPAKAVSSKVELKNTDTIAETAKANAASVVVGGVDEIAEAITPSGTDKITIALTVEPKAADASNTQQTAIKTKSGGKNVEFLDLTLTKQVNDAAPSDIGSTNSKLLTINVPFDTTGVDISSITVYRYHGTAAETFTQITNVADKADGKFMVNDDYISIYAEKFSTYAIGYINAASNGGSASYAVTANAATHGSITANTKNASVGSTVTLTVKPDKGYTLETLTVKDAKGNEVTLTAVKLGETYTFKMPSSTVTVSATFKVVQGNIFIDVYASDYYFDAVQWAAENGITSGVDATHFAPNDITTRGQMVTFLWRAAGCPEPTTTTCAFTDLKADEFYYKAVLWGCEKGLIKGYDATTFAPDDNVTRGQTVAFLARYEGVKDEATGYTHGFSDVAASDYYNNAVAWAATNKVTEGTSATTFAPNDSCLRAQIVTFIYRNFAK